MLTNLYAKLDSLYKEDSNQVALIAYDMFERYVRPFDMPVVDDFIQFERMTVKLKNQKLSLTESALV